MTSILELREVSACYDKALILDRVDLDVHEGESVALLGRNGVGKTTTVLSVFGVPQVTTGTILVGGQRLTGRRQCQAAELGVSLVPQGRRVLSRLTVEENLKLGAAPRRNGPWNLARIYDLFPILGERARTSGQALSGGQLQMVAVARALMSNPRLILLDEPFEGLAPVIVQQLTAALGQVQREGTTLLVVEQRVDTIRSLADRYVVMAKGRIARSGSMAGVDAEELHRQIVL